MYLLDNLGSVLGGLAFLVVLVHWFNHFGMLYFAAAAEPALSPFCWRRLRANGSWRRRRAFILASLVGLMMLVDLSAVSRRLEYEGQQVVFDGDSAYGSLVVTRSAGSTQLH